MAVIGGATADGDVLGQMAVPLKAQDQAQRATEVAKLVLGAYNLQLLKGHRLASIGLCWDDDAPATLAHTQLRGVGVGNVALIPENTAAASLVDKAPRDPESPPGRRRALLVAARDTATLSLLDGPSPELVGTSPLAAEACAQLIGKLDSDTTEAIYLVGEGTDWTKRAAELRETTPIRVVVPDEPEFAVARGAALTAPKVVKAAAPATNAPGASSSGPNTSAALTAMLAAAAKRSQAKPRTAPALSITNFSRDDGIAPRYSDVTVKLKVAPPKPKEQPPVESEAETDAADAETTVVTTAAVRKATAAKTTAATKTAPPVVKKTAPPVVKKTAPPVVKKTAAPAHKSRRASRRPRMLVGSALSAFVVAGVAAIALTAASGIDPTSEQAPADPAPAQLPEAPATAAIDQQGNPGPEVVVAPAPAMVQAPVGDAVLGEIAPAPEELIVPEFVDPGFVDVPEAPVVDVVPEAPVVDVPVVPEAVPPVAEVPVVTAPDPALVQPETPHLPAGAPEVVVPNTSVPADGGPQPLPRVEDVVPGAVVPAQEPVPHLPVAPG